MTISFNGLASGLDTGSLIDQLVSVERSSATKLTTRQSDLNTQKSIVNSLSTALASLGTLARGMDLGSEVSPRKATSSDAHVLVASSASAAATVHDVRVRQLARTQITSSRTFASPAAGVLGDGNVTITTGGTPATVSWTSADSLADIASRINDSGAGASASVLFDGTSYRLVLAAKGTGTAAAPTFSDAGDGLALADPANRKVAARDAIVTIDGIDVTRGTNLIDDAVPGVTITAVSEHAVAEADSHLTVSLDRDALRDKVKALVTAYNAVNSALHVQLDFNGTKKGANTLFGDSTLRQLQSALGSVMTNSYGQDTLSSLGINRDKTGAMTLDETKLSDALAKSPDAVAKLFVTGGFATAVSGLTDQYTQASTGLLALKTQGMTDRAKAIQSQIDHINTSADSLRSRLEKQFNALEQAMSKFQGQSQFLARALG